MSKLLEEMRDLIRTLHYSYRTEEAYLNWSRQNILFQRQAAPYRDGSCRSQRIPDASRSHDRLRPQLRIRRSRLFCFSIRMSSKQECPQSKNVLKAELPSLKNVERAKRPSRIPLVLTRAEVKCLLTQLGQQNWLQASLLYGAGLRLRECLSLRVKDLDFDYQQIAVRDAKGHKDRVTMLPASAAEASLSLCGRIVAGMDRKWLCLNGSRCQQM